MDIKENYKIIFISTILTLTNIIIVSIYSLLPFSFKDYHFSFALSLSIAYSIAHIGLCLYLRFKGKGYILKGIFLYQILGALAFLFLFLFRLGGLQINFLERFFNYWSFPQMPLAHIFSLKGYFPELIVRAITYYIYTFISGNAYLQMKKDFAFKRKMEEKRQMEEESIKRQEKDL